MEAFRRLELREPLTVPLADFWPRRGPVWDGLGVTTAGTAILLEAKAHIPEAVSPKTMASAESLKKIRASLEAARSILAPRSTTDWCVNFYQYANRLAFHLFLSRTNGLPSKLVFLYFTHAVAMGGPSSEEEWHGATRLIHAVLGVPADLRRYGVYDAFLDARELTLEA